MLTLCLEEPLEDVDDPVYGDGETDPRVTYAPSPSVTLAVCRREGPAAIFEGGQWWRGTREGRLVTSGAWGGRLRCCVSATKAVPATYDPATELTPVQPKTLRFQPKLLRLNRRFFS